MRTFYALLLLILQGITAPARAVMLDPSGEGQVLIVPWYSAADGEQTLLSIVNSDHTGKAVKLRFHEAKNGREVAVFNLYLAEFDVWTGAIFAADADGPARLVTNDTSCTVPAIRTSTVLPQLPDGRRYLPFDTGDFSGTRADPFPPTPARTREGHVEIFEMGELIDNSDSDRAATHVRGAPFDCNMLVQAWQPGGYWQLDPSVDMLASSGSLSAAAAVVQIQIGRALQCAGHCDQPLQHRCAAHRARCNDPESCQCGH